MNHTLPPRSVVQAASDAVVGYALEALAPEFHSWTKDVNMNVAEFIWNAGGRNLDPSVFHAPGGDLSGLARRLCEARREVPAEVDDVMLLDLDVHHRNGEIVFTFRLSWDMGQTLQPCEITVDAAHAPPANAN
jgi:hypothetical protein